MSFRPPPNEEQAPVTPRVAVDFCARVVEHVASAIDGTLPLALARHVDHCPTCLEVVCHAHALGEGIRREADHYDHAVDFESRVLAALP